MKRWNCTLTREIIFVRQIAAESVASAEAEMIEMIREETGDPDFVNENVEVSEVEETPDPPAPEDIELDEMEGGL